MQDSIYHIALVIPAVAQLNVFFSSGLHWVLVMISMMQYCFSIESKSVRGPPVRPCVCPPRFMQMYPLLNRGT